MTGGPFPSPIGSAVSIPAGAVLAILFFLPWLSLECDGKKIGSSSGWQLSTGDMTPAGSLAKMEDEAKRAGDVDEKQDVKARPWFILGLAVPLIAMVVGVSGVRGTTRRSTVGTILILLGILGVGVMILAANVDYAEEMKGGMKSQAESPSELPKQNLEKVDKGTVEQIDRLQTEPTGTLWLCLVLYVAVGACGALNLILPSRSRTPAAAVPTSPAEPPEEPD